jgi:hypothetical protein
MKPLKIKLQKHRGFGGLCGKALAPPLLQCSKCKAEARNS